MIERYIAINRTLRAMMRHCINATEMEGHDDGSVLILMHEYVRNDLRELERLWPESLSRKALDWLHSLIIDEFAKQEIGNLYLVTEALKDIEDEVDKHFGQASIGDMSVAILDLLHPLVIASSYSHFKNGSYRDAVLDAFLAVFDLLRQKSGLAIDGAALAGEALSLDNPRLIISTLETESGKNEQKGMIQMLQGAYLGIRNPKAHTLAYNPSQLATAQNLVFASLLARRLDEAQVVPQS